MFEPYVGGKKKENKKCESNAFLGYYMDSLHQVQGHEKINWKTNT